MLKTTGFSGMVEILGEKAAKGNSKVSTRVGYSINGFLDLLKTGNPGSGGGVPPVPENLPVAFDKTFTVTQTKAGEPVTLLATKPNYVTSGSKRQFSYPDVSSGIAFTLEPLDYLTFPTTVNVAFTIPIPLGVATATKQIRITTAAGTEIPSTVTEVLRWPQQADAKVLRESYLRSVLVRINTNFPDANGKALKVWFNGGRSSEPNYTFSVASVQHAISTSSFFSDEYSAGEGIKENNAVAVFPVDWLTSCVVRGSKMLELGNSLTVLFDGIEGDYQVSSYTYPTNGGGTYAGDPEALPRLEQFAKSIVNDVRPHVVEGVPNVNTNGRQYIEYEQNGFYEPWLYDRASFLWTMYMRTGKLKWYRHANRATQFYANHISQTGYFDLRADDLKYSYPNAMKNGLIFTGNTSFIEVAERLVLPATTFDASYTYVEFTGANNVPLWTERNAAYALLSLLNAWEITGTASYLTDATTIVNTLITHQNTPQNTGWATDGGLYHTIYAHEGGDGGGTGNEYGASPWMSAILSDAMFSYYYHTEDKNVLTFLSKLGDYFATHATRAGVDGESTGRTITKYFAGPGYEFSDAQWDVTDAEHIPDVLGACYRCLWAKKELGEDTADLDTVAVNLRNELTWIVDYWIREAQATIDAGYTIFRCMPPRKTLWWVMSCMDMTHLADEVFIYG